ncbi:MAG: hypothetical protein ACRD96_20600, partial [Bryobacteraceae bacterium]
RGSSLQADRCRGGSWSRRRGIVCGEDAILMSMRSALARFIFWDYPRASWQYDVMVGIILAFIFLTPREWFRDQPRIPHASSIASLPADHGSDSFWIDSELLAGVPEPERPARLTTVLRARTGKKLTVTRIQPIFDEKEKELKGFVAFTQP